MRNVNVLASSRAPVMALCCSLVAARGGWWLPDPGVVEVEVAR